MKNYSWETLDRLPTEKLAIQFPRNPIDSAKDYIVRFWTKTGNDWVGNFHGIDKQYYTNVISWPKPDFVCVISGGFAFIVQIDDPETYEELPVVPITDARFIPEAQIVALATFTNIYGFGVNGLLWSTDSLAMDGIEIKEITDGKLYGTADNAFEKNSFTIDIKTGEVT